MRKKVWIQMGISNALWLILLVLLYSANRTSLIIAIGVRSTNTLLNVGRVLLWVAFAVVNGFFLIRLWKTRPPKPARAAEPAPVQPWQTRLSDPEEIRKELLSMLEKRPALSEALQQGLNQMDSLYRKHTRLKDVNRRDKLAYGGHAFGALENAETVLCNHLVKVVNHADLCDPSEASPANLERQGKHRREIQKLLLENQKVLDGCEELISKTVSYGEGKVGAPDVDALSVTTSIDALNYLLQKTGHADL